jgi:hypothetical protein
LPYQESSALQRPAQSKYRLKPDCSLCLDSFPGGKEDPEAHSPARLLR